MRWVEGEVKGTDVQRRQHTLRLPVVMHLCYDSQYSVRTRLFSLLTVEGEGNKHGTVSHMQRSCRLNLVP
eukprot:3717527-Amphidinium_carterae.1